MGDVSGQATGSQGWHRAVPVATAAMVTASVGWMLLRGRSVDVLYARWVLHNAPTAVFGASLGAMVLRRRPGHAGGRLLVLIGVVSAAHVALVSLGDARLVAAGVPEQGSEFVPFAPAEVPLDASIPMWASSWLWLIAAIPAITLLLLVFPTGHPPSPRWRWAAVTAAVSTVIMVCAYAIETWPTSDAVLQVRGQASTQPVAVAMATAGGVLVLTAAAASATSLVVRWRRAAPEERHQIRPMVITGAALVVVFVATFPWQWLWIPASMVALWSFLITYAIGVGRYRFHDLDVVVNRAVVATVLAAGVTLAYLAVVVGVGSLAGRGRDSAVIPLLGAGIVAVAFEPARRRVQRLVSRVLYGRDQDAAAVLADLSERIRSASGPQQVLDDISRLLVRNTGAERASITIPMAGTALVEAAHGTATRTEPLRSVPVVHDGETLGQIELWARAPTDLVPDADELLRAVAGTLGVVLRNVRLTTELRQQVEELRRSRLRLVQAQEEARRTLERDIHDGAQARLVALRIRVGIVAALAETGRWDDARAAIDELGPGIDEAVRSLRSLGHGLQPPALEGAGIAAALRAEARHLPVAVRIDDGGIGRYQPTIEAAVYFTCIEAIQNAIKHGRAGTVHVALANGAADLELTVRDDGVGFDATSLARSGRGVSNMRDRIHSLGGTLAIESRPGGGTTVRGTVPVVVDDLAHLEDCAQVDDGAGDGDPDEPPTPDQSPVSAR